MAEPESTMSTANDAAGEEPEVTKAPPSLPPRPPSFSLGSSQHSAAASTDVTVDTNQIDAAATPVTVQAEAEQEPTSADVPAAIVLEAPADTNEVTDLPARSLMPFGHDAGAPTEEEIEKMRLQIRNIDTGEAFDNIDTFADQQVYSNYTLLPAASEFKDPAPQPKRQSLRWPGRGHKASKSITDPNAVKVDITGKGTSDAASLLSVAHDLYARLIAEQSALLLLPTAATDATTAIATAIAVAIAACIQQRVLRPDHAARGESELPHLDRRVLSRQQPASSCRPGRPHTATQSQRRCSS
eukprot:10125-Heterococcus_DN1.PRE.2